MTGAIKKLLGRETKFPTATKHVTKYAFTVGGIDYYEFDTTANLPWKRGLKFLSIYNELDMRCDRFYLESLCKAILDQFNKPKIGFNEMSNIKTWVQQTQERLNWVYHEDLVYKLASVVFFDKNENPDDWEWKYASAKIEHWKKNEGVQDFFLREPIKRLIPFLNNSALSILTYSQTQKEQDLAQLANLLEGMSGSRKIDLPNYTARYFSEEMKQSSV